MTVKGKIITTGDKNSGELTRHEAGGPSAADEAAAAGLAPQTELEKKLHQYGFVELEFATDGSFTIPKGDLAN